MPLPPMWKIRREVARLGRQLHEWPADLHNTLFATAHYDRALRNRIRRFPGRLPGSDRVAIYLIYPGSGLLQSHLDSLEYLRGKGYAALAVSNLPLSDANRDRLLGACWEYMERPNFGYDFGGYRDAILDLADRLPKLERLVLLNDSTWFPLPGARDWLEDVERLGVDFGAAASNYGAPRPELEEFRSMVWKYRSSHRNFHYCSFALFFRPDILKHPDFLGYWRGLRLSDEKKRTVRRGEIGLSQWVLAKGFSHGATLDIASLDRDLEALDDAALLDVARHLIIPEDPRLQDLRRKVLALSPDRAELIRLILITVSLQGSSYALAAYSIFWKGFPFLKKSPLWLSRESSDLSLDLARRLNGGPAETIQQEMEAIRTARKISPQ